jgi:uncharacterized membrane protein
MSLDFTTTILLLILSLAVVLAMALLDRRRPPPGEVRLFPVLPVMMLAGLVAILMLAHLVSLWTGQPLMPRRGF